MSTPDDGSTRHEYSTRRFLLVETVHGEIGDGEARSYRTEYAHDGVWSTHPTAGPMR